MGRVRADHRCSTSERFDKHGGQPFLARRQHDHRRTAHVAVRVRVETQAGDIARHAQGMRLLHQSLAKAVSEVAEHHQPRPCFTAKPRERLHQSRIVLLWRVSTDGQCDRRRVGREPRMLHGVRRQAPDVGGGNRVVDGRHAAGRQAQGLLRHVAHAARHRHQRRGLGVERPRHAQPMAFAEPGAVDGNHDRRADTAERRRGQRRRIGVWRGREQHAWGVYAQVPCHHVPENSLLERHRHAKALADESKPMLAERRRRPQPFQRRALRSAAAHRRAADPPRTEQPQPGRHGVVQDEPRHEQVHAVAPVHQRFRQVEGDPLGAAAAQARQHHADMQRARVRERGRHARPLSGSRGWQPSRPGDAFG